MGHRTALIGIAALLATVSAGSAATISTGRRVDIEEHLVAGKHNLVYFGAKWCGPCREWKPRVEAAAAEDVEVLVIDIGNWGSPVSKQYDIRSVPAVWLYDPDGARVDAGGPWEVLPRLERRLGRSLPVPQGGAGGAVSPGLLFALVFAGAVGIALLLVLAPRVKRPATAQRTTPLRRPQPPPAEQVGTAWMVQLDGRMEGPFSRAQLESLGKRGLVSAATPARGVNEAQWRTVGELIH